MTAWFVTSLVVCAATVASCSASMETLDDLAAYNSQLSLLLAKADQLDVYSRKSDCFRRASDHIRAHCGELDMYEDERVKAAISMTLCELATANHSPPLECERVLLETDIFSADQRHRSCVEALSRSAQYWSSYSGYLREVTQLCYAFRAWNNIDSAREIYQNATYTISSVLQYMDAALLRNQAVQERTENVMELTNEILGHVLAGGIGFQNVSKDLRHEFAVIEQRISAAVEAIVADTYNHNRAERQSTLSQMMVALDSATERYQTAIDLLAASVQNSLERRVEGVFLAIYEDHKSLYDQANTAFDQWRFMRNDMQAMHSSVMALTSFSREATTHLQTFTEDAIIAHRTQRNATQSAVKLTEVLRKLSETTDQEMRQLNETALILREQILSSGRTLYERPGQRWSELAKFGLSWLLEMRLHVEPSHIQTVIRLPIVRALWYLLDILYFALHTSTTSITSLFFLAWSCKNWLLSCQTVRARPPYEHFKWYMHIHTIESSRPDTRQFNMLDYPGGSFQNDPASQIPHSGQALATMFMIYALQRCCGIKPGNVNELDLMSGTTDARYPAAQGNIQGMPLPTLRDPVQ